MQVIISGGRGVVLTPSFKALVTHKVQKLARVLPRVLDARVVCDAEKFRRRARLHLRTTRRTLASEATADDLLSAVEGAVAAALHQARKAKTRRRRRRPRPAHRRGESPSRE